MTASRCAALPPVLVLGLGTGDQSISPDTACLLENIEVLAAPAVCSSIFRTNGALPLPPRWKKLWRPWSRPAQKENAAPFWQTAIRCCSASEPLLPPDLPFPHRKVCESSPESAPCRQAVPVFVCPGTIFPFFPCTGRKDWLPLAHAVLTGKPLCIYTDCRNNAAAIAAFLLERGMDRFQMIVASCLNTNDERISSHTLSEAAATAFRGDESVFLLPLSEKEQTGTLRFGLDESKLALDRGLYTKGSGAGCGAVAAVPLPGEHSVGYRRRLRLPVSGSRNTSP